MQNEIYTIYHLTIAPENFDVFKALVEQIVAATSQETGAINYEYVVNADRTQVHIVERYTAEALLPHVQQTFAPYAERFLALASIDTLYVYGETTAEMRAVLDGFGANYLTPFAGFSR